MVFDLMCELDATEDQLDFTVVYGSAKNGWMSDDYNKPTDNIDYLLDKIVEIIPAPKQLEGTPQLLITSRTSQGRQRHRYRQNPHGLSSYDPYPRRYGVP